MVVNRKQPVVPVPPISRTSSSQPAPAKRQTRSSKATPRNDQKSNGHRPTSSGSTKSEKKQKSKTSMDFLILCLLSAFTLYSFYVCRPNPLFSMPTYESQPSLCRALATYRTHVLDPYVLPPIKQTLHYGHRISKPYVEEAQVRLSPYIKPAQNVADTLTPHAKSFVGTTKRFWKNSVIPIYTQNLRPYYETAVVPRYIRYVKPLLVPLQSKAQNFFTYYVSNPVRSKTNFFLHKLHQFYTLRVDPYVRIARSYVYRFLDKTRAIAINLSTVYTKYLQPSLLKVWNAAHSTICTTWKLFFEVFFRFTDGIYAYVKWVTREVGAYRRQYVDRHVYRILEQVADPKVNGNVKVADNGLSSVIDARIPSESQELPDMSPPLTATADALESGPSPIQAVPIPAVPFPATSQVDSSMPMPNVEATNNQETGTSVPTPLNAEFKSALSVAEKSADYASTAIHELQKEFDTLIVSDITPTPTALNIPSVSAEEVLIMEPAAAEPASSPTPESDQELDDFLRELDTEQPTNADDTVEETQDEPVRPKSKEELLAETAAKRADIVGRHEKWFEKLHSGVQEAQGDLVRTLQALRDDSAKGIRRLMTKADPNEVDKESAVDTRSLIWLEHDSEKLIKGLEMYLRKAEARCINWKISGESPDDEAKELRHEVASKEKEKFSDIVSKVEGKFSIHIDDVRLEIHTRYVALKEREFEEVIRACNVIRGLALRAQEDIALDYAWLDDVTVLDWQKYHDLIRVSDTFGVTARQIANGTSTDPLPPSDPVPEALDELDSELQDIIIGFNYALSGMRSQGFKIFNSRPLNVGGNDDDINDGFFAVKDNEKRIDDLRGVDLGKVKLKGETVGILPTKQDDHDMKGAEDSVGILPVPDAQLPENSESGFDASKVIIGKDKVQVEEALRDIPLERPAQRL